MQRVGDVNFKRNLNARLKLGCGFESDVKVAFAFHCRKQTQRAQQKSDAFHETILAILTVLIALQMDSAGRCGC